MKTIALPNRAGEIIAETIVDDEDFELFAHLPWHLSVQGYAVRVSPRTNGRQYGYRLHREILGLALGDPLQGDHINGDRLDNRRSNLRVVEAFANAQNVNAQANGRSAHRGVYWCNTRKRWAAQVRTKARTYQGFFATETEAAIAASNARRELMPFSNEERFLCR